MKKLFLFIFLIAVLNTAFSQTIYTFIGNGYWTVSANWSFNTVPPAVLPAGSAINISPQPGDTCILNTVQVISPGASLTISPGANFIINGNLYTYPYVNICDKAWTSRNLDVSVYKNGDPIPQVTDSVQWNSLTTGAWCWYRNDSAAYAAEYGKLYNWYAVNDPRGLAPSGWHIATDNEWSDISRCAGFDTSAGGRLKDTVLWAFPNTGAANSFGFSSRPGGRRGINNPASFSEISIAGYWWTASQYDTLPADASYRSMSYTTAYLYRGHSNKRNGFSVRCVKNSVPVLSTATITSITATGASGGGNASNDGVTAIIQKGICWSVDPLPTILNNKTSDGAGSGNFTSSITGLLPNTTYYVRAYAVNSEGVGYGPELSFTTALAPDSTFTDPRDGQVYTYRRIGTQVWMTKNLNYAADSSWCYRNNTANCDVYGRLYTWYSAMNAAPPGWHLPTIEEWRRLGISLSSDWGFPFFSYSSGGDMKAVTLWASPNYGATNSSGFTGLPGGLRNLNGSFNYLGSYGMWWSATETDTVNSGSVQLFYNGSNLATDASSPRLMGYSVRCIKDEFPVVETGVFSAVTSTTAVSGGKVINNIGAVITARGVCWSTQANPTIAGNKTTDALVGEEYTSNLTGLLPNTRYHVRAYATNSIGTGYGDDAVFSSFGPLATVSTYLFYPDTSTAALCGGDVLNEGDFSVTARGVCWSTTPNPTTTSDTAMEVSGTGHFSRLIKTFLPATTYYVRAFAITAAGTSYGDQQTFTTIGYGPRIYISGFESITSYSASISVEVQAHSYSMPVTSRGVCWGIAPNPGINNSHTSNGSGAVSFNAGISNLLSNTVYYVRPYAITSDGIVYYGDQSSFATEKLLPQVSTNVSYSNLTRTSVVSGGTVATTSVPAVTARGVCWSIYNNPTVDDNKTTDGSGFGSFSSNITGLLPGTTYNIRAYAQNSEGIAYGYNTTITTKNQLPVVSATATVSTIGQTNAVSGGIISDDGGLPVLSRGVCWDTTAQPGISGSKTIDGSGIGTFTSNMSGLTPNTLYYVRAYATNSAGTSYGPEKTFVSLTALNGPAVAICNQQWATANLSVRTYRNGDVIPQVTNSNTWSDLTTGAWCWYNNDSATYAAVYGRLYNWYAVNDPRGLAPEGWHIPTKSELKILLKCIDPAVDTVCADCPGNISQLGGGALKEAGTTHWLSPNEGATNSSGFTALPGGKRSLGSFSNINTYGYLWSRTPSALLEASGIRLSYIFSFVGISAISKNEGLSVRCIKD